MIAWFLLRKPSGLDLAAVPWWGWLGAAALGGFGQLLNVGIFRAIGHEGVYYGERGSVPRGSPSRVAPRQWLSGC